MYSNFPPLAARGFEISEFRESQFRSQSPRMPEKRRMAPQNIDCCIFAIFGTMFAFINMIFFSCGIYYCWCANESWFSVAATPFIAILWLLATVVLVKKIWTNGGRLTWSEKEENRSNNEGSVQTNNLMPPGTLVPAKEEREQKSHKLD